MKKLLLLFLLTAAVPSQAGPFKAREFGAGVLLGNPTGATAKYWLDERFAVDGGVGYSGGTALYADFLAHSWDLLPRVERGVLGVYAGAGPRLEFDRDVEFGIRTLAGALYRPQAHRLEIFLEFGPVFRVAPDGGVGLDGGAGVRFYF